MKKVVQLLVLAALLAVPALAQTPSSTGATGSAASGQDDAQAKIDLYKKFTDNVPRKDRPGDPKAAYEAGKEYVAKYEPVDGPNDQYVKYIKNWLATYEVAARRAQFFQQVSNKQYNEAFASAKQVLTDTPDDVAVLYRLVQAGFAAAVSDNNTNNADAIAYAKQLIPLVQNGKNPDPSKSKDEVLDNLNYAIAIFLRNTQPTEAANYFINAIQFGGYSKKNPQTYLYLVDIYEKKGDYPTLANQYSVTCKTPEQIQSADCMALKAKIDQIVDHIIDALARAIASNDASPNAAANRDARAALLEQLTGYYKYRNNGSDTGLKELIAGIMSRPIPKPGEPVTPPIVPSTPPTSSSNTTPSSTTSAGKTATPSGKSPSTKTPRK
jgi:hypothetical protein